MKILLCVLVPMVIYSLAGVAPSFRRETSRKRKYAKFNGFLRVDADHDSDLPADAPRARPSRVGKFQSRSSSCS